jgi:hypothetical protein
VTDDTVRLYGTTEPAPAPRLLRAGPLEAVLDGGALRAVRWHGLEVLRAVSFLVRIEGWGTPALEPDVVAISEEPGGFTVQYQATVRSGAESLSVHLTYAGEASGALRATAVVDPRTDFHTNRTGFVVLHPLHGVAGAPVTVEHVDGTRKATTLPAEISPGQPLRAIRALTHAPAPGVTAETRLLGDTFEMEDHRNWSDASFKTYSRPLALPFPYLLPAGRAVEQAVALTVTGAPAAGRGGAAAPDDAVVVRVGEPRGTAPRIGLLVPAEHARAALSAVPALRAAAPQRLLGHLDLGAGHGAAELTALAALAAGTGTLTRAALEVLVPDDADPDAALARVAAAAATAGLAPAAVAVFQKSDQVSFQPGEPRPPGATLEALYAAARRAFPGVPLGGGTPAFFTELNRRRPPAGLLDFVTHGTCPIVHAADDRSVMETLEALPFIVRSAQAIAGQAAHHLGPIAIGARLNPYGKAPAENPHNGRVGLGERDPRQRALFGAAWYLGYAATVAPLGVRELVLAAPVGPAGLVFQPQAWAQPWYDGRAQPGSAVFPAYHVVADLAAAAEQPLLDVTVADPARVAALAYAGVSGPRLLLANLTPSPQRVRLEGLAGALAVRLLDAAAFEGAALEPEGFRRSARPLAPGEALVLPPHATAAVGDRP